MGAGQCVETGLWVGGCQLAVQLMALAAHCLVGLEVCCLAPQQLPPTLEWVKASIAGVAVIAEKITS